MSLSEVLYRRYTTSARDQCTDLDEAILLLRKALTLLPPALQLRLGGLMNLTRVLCDRFHHSICSYDHSVEMVFLDEAISLLDEILAQLPVTHPRQPSVLDLQSCTLKELYKHSRQLPNLDNSISLQRDNLLLTPPMHPDRPINLCSLGHALYDRFLHSGQSKDLKEAIEVTQESLWALTEMDPDVCNVAQHLGRLFHSRYLLTQTRKDLDDVMEAFRVAVGCESAVVSQRFIAAQQWAKYADASDHVSAIDAYVEAIGLMPRLAYGLDLQSRQSVLTPNTDGLARNAAACAIRTGRLDMAVELLEEGRAVFWSQVLQLRTPLSELMLKAPEIGQKLNDISNALARGSLRDVFKNIPNTSNVALEEQEGSRLRHLNEQWQAGLKEVRKIDGFETFLLLKHLETLQLAAANGPVVILNASERDCAALVLKSAEADVLHVPLPKFSPFHASPPHYGR